ncbi:membrane protein [Streptomyces sp. NRRL S-87]|uniref:divisome protein SepX/GlpR n=1 Tax=Streptomyces sp. NRRL S-87 TaxID=1463920 RepID=UPI0004BF13E0|nr:membrane protein [Streptomyces sp. NRRL S-87]
MSSSGLIYAVIVGAWAAYLVPMWLRRQDELNEARPTERFSTAIRLLSGRAGMERRYAKGLRERGEVAEPRVEPDAVTEAISSVDVDVRDSVVPPTRPEPAVVTAERARRIQRTKVLARRRRTTALLFLGFTFGAVVAAVGGLRFLWAPAVPAVMLSSYIVYLRVQERRRFAFTMDRRRAEAAAQRLRESRRHPAPDVEPGDAPVRPAEPEPAPAVSPQEAGRRALVEQTDHAEWVDQQRERGRGPARGDSWEPVPVPLPTYVTAPVAPRATGPSVADGWSPARSSTAEPTDPRLKVRPGNPSGTAPAKGGPPPTGAAQPGEPGAAPGQQRPAPPRRPRDRGRTPLFDQFDPDNRPRAANE